MAEKEFTCPVAGTLSMIGGKYKSIILISFDEGRRYVIVSYIKNAEGNG